MKVLVVDDEPAVLKMYRLALEQAGHSVVVAPDGPSGLKLANDEQPDLILLDIIMPNVNGLDVLADLKKDPATKAIPVYLLTNLPESSSGAKARALGADGYLVKAEVEPGHLAKILEQISKRTKPNL